MQAFNSDVPLPIYLFENYMVDFDIFYFFGIHS